MNARIAIGVLATATAIASAVSGPGAGAAQQVAAPAVGTVCEWGGTAASPTGTFSISPGLTDAASTQPSAFYVTGELAGGAGCHGTLTFRGQIDAGANCLVQTFGGHAIGIPGVVSFGGVGVTVLGPALLYD